MLKYLRSTSLRLALGYAGLFLVSSMALIGLVWWNTTGYLDRETDAVIAADIRAIGDRLQDFGLAGAIQTVNERVLADADKKAIYLLTDPVLTPLAGNVDAWPAEIGRQPGWHEVDLVYQNRLHATRLLHVVLRGNFHLLVGRDVQERVAMRGLFLRSFGWAVIVGPVPGSPRGPAMSIAGRRGSGASRAGTGSIWSTRTGCTPPGCCMWCCAAISICWSAATCRSGWRCAGCSCAVSAGR